MPTEIKAPTQPKLNVFVPFTRRWAVDKFLASLDKIELPLNETYFVFYNDTNDSGLQQKLVDYLQERYFYINGGMVYGSGNDVPDEYDIDLRRQRIIDMRTKAQHLLSDADLTFCLEDDTLAPENAFKTLLWALQSKSYSLVSGVQVGRHAINALGAWLIEPLDKPGKVETLSPSALLQEVVEVDGTGMFCFLTPTELYKRANFHEEAECLGPDVCYGLDLRRKGLRIGVCTNLICGHMTQHEGVLLPSNKTSVAMWKRGRRGWKMI